jgi:hypothetical protein
MHKLEAITVCVNYADFLAETLPINMQFFDRFVVVTTPEDKATQALCQKYSVPCVVTDCPTEQGQAFNKGKAINLGLGHLNADAWMLHLDADIVLPHNFRTLLQHARLEKDCIYGADRLNIYGWQAWQDYKKTGHISHAYRYLVMPPPFELGARLLHQEFGYTPIGYFQLWNGSRHYPTHQGNAEHTDVLFALQWPRTKRVLLPEVFCVHLDSNNEPTKMGQNWNGRQSPPFGPYKP